MKIVSLADDLDGGKMIHQGLNLKSPDELPPSSSIHNPSPSGPFPNPSLLMPSSSLNVSSASTAAVGTANSNFYENTMQSDNSSLQKRKSVISSQSTGSSNEVGC